MCTKLLQVHFLTSPAAPLLRHLTTHQTGQQYSYYAKNAIGCFRSEIICTEHGTLPGLRVSPVFQNIHLVKIIQPIHRLASNTEFKQLHSFKTLQS